MPSHLVETGTRFYLKEKLYSCYEKQYFYNNLFFNISLLFGVVLIITLLLVYARNRKKSITEEDIKSEDERTRRENMNIIMEARNAYDLHQKQASELLYNPWDPLLPFKAETDF
jgi:hypothetical protein